MEKKLSPRITELNSQITERIPHGLKHRLDEGFEETFRSTGNPAVNTKESIHETFGLDPGSNFVHMNEEDFMLENRPLPDTKVPKKPTKKYRS